MGVSMPKKNAIWILLFAILMLNFGTTFVSASYVTINKTIFVQEFQADADGHTYVYAEPDMSKLDSTTLANYSNELTVKRYAYSDNRWFVFSYGLPGVGIKRNEFQDTWFVDQGWLSNFTYLPSFYDFANTTNSYELSAMNKIAYFGMPIDEEVSVIIDPHFRYYGTFNVTDQEFFHLTVASQQDGPSFVVYVLDPNGRTCGFIVVDDGNIDVLPFAPTVPGMYYVGILATGSNPSLYRVNLLLKPIEPESLQMNEIADGVLPGSEFMVKNGDGDIIQKEKAPTARTFKVKSNSTTPAVVEYAINHPELKDAVYTPFDPRVEVTSDKVLLPDGSKFMENLGSDGGAYYYQSFHDEYYYITIIGMEETAYSFYNHELNPPSLPTGVPLYTESQGYRYDVIVYKLVLAHDSILLVNTTNPSAMGWKLLTVSDDMVYRSQWLDDNDLFNGATPTYIPKGTYLILGYHNVLGSPLTTFTLGPVIDGPGPVSVDYGSVIGVRVPTNYLKFYETNITLLNHENLTVQTHYAFINQYGDVLQNSDELNLGNKQSGTQWVANPINQSTIITGLKDPYEMFTNGYGILMLSPFLLLNTTIGNSIMYEPRTIAFNLTFTEYNSRLIKGSATWTTGTTQWVNITFGDNGNSQEYYLLEIDGTLGTWYNVTMLKKDIISVQDVSAYQIYHGYTQILDQDSLKQWFTSHSTYNTYQVGLVSDKLLLLFKVQRDPNVAGSIDFLVEPYTTNRYQYPPMPHYYPSSAAAGGPVLGVDPIVIAGGIGVVAVVVVAIYVIKVKRGSSA